MSVSELNGIGNRLLVIFDGHCVLCNRLVRWFVRRDLRDRLRFVASESPKITELLARRGLDSAFAPRTILVVREFGGAAEQILVRSDAVLALLAELPHPWRTVGVVLRCLPRPVLELGYRLIARWRHRIWGRLESCPIPTAEEQGRFL